MAAPNDDGINFLSALRAEDVIEQPLVVEFGPDEQAASVWRTVGTGRGAEERVLASRRLAKMRMAAAVEAYTPNRAEDNTKPARPSSSRA